MAIEGRQKYHYEDAHDTMANGRLYLGTRQTYRHIYAHCSRTTAQELPMQFTMTLSGTETPKSEARDAETVRLR